MMPPTTAAPQLRVLHLHSTFDAGGKELRAVALMNAFGTGLRHAVVSAQPGATAARAGLDPALSVGFPFGFPPLAGKFSVQRMRTLARAMAPFDLILSYNWGAIDAVMAHALFAPGMRLPPLVHHEDGFNAEEAVRLSRRRNWYRMLALARASALVVPSRRLETIAHGQWRQGAGKVVRIANGIDTAAFAHQPHARSLPRLVKRAGEIWIGTVAGLRPVKNLRRLVRAFAGLDDRFQLVILGEGPERAAILAQAAALGLPHRVHLPGFVADPAKVIGLFDVFALSSDSEQFPLSVVEAMAAGLPVASPAVGDVAEIVAPENRAFITPPGDTEALGTALRALGESPDLRARLGAANRARACAEFDVATMVGHYAALYARVLGRDRFP
jgi:glycosyltransferase involved in cell wall biosynthesis